MGGGVRERGEREREGEREGGGRECDRGERGEREREKRGGRERRNMLYTAQ